METITQEQLRQLEYNDRRVLNYDKYSAIQRKRDEQLEEGRKQRTKDTLRRVKNERVVEEKTYMLPNLSIVKESELSEEEIDLLTNQGMADARN